MCILLLYFCGTECSQKVDLVRRHQNRSAFVLNLEHYEFCQFGLAGVSPDDVNIIRAFVECLTGCQGYFLPVPHLHHDGTLKDINKCVRVVAMYRVRAARGIFHEQQQTFPCRECPPNPSKRPVSPLPLRGSLWPPLWLPLRTTSDTPTPRSFLQSS